MIRIKLYAGTIFFLFFILVLRLFHMQIIKHEEYIRYSENNRIRVVPLEAARGRIYDRNENLLVSNRISFDIAVVYSELRDKNEVKDILCDIIDIDQKAIKDRIESCAKRPFIPIKIIEDIDKEKAIQIEELIVDMPGVIVTTRPVRNYIYKDTISHITGYLGLISEKELEKYKTYGYHMRESFGKDGIERNYNEYLRGKDGGLQVEVDSRGRQVSLIAVKEPLSGKDLKLNIDLDLQKFCSDILGKDKGVIIAMNPENGEVFALVSHPTFDPNVFVSSKHMRKVEKLLKDSKAFPLLDRAIGGTYPPGSIFKIIIATCALDEGFFNKEKTFYCNGRYHVGNRVFRCWKEKGHGVQAIIEAIKHSCNVFFYQLGLLIGPDNISKYAIKFGLGHPTGIDLPGEVSGFVPTRSWKRKRFRETWFKGETANYSIGQGYLLVTPIQIVRAFSIVANGGKLVEPRIVKKIEDVEMQYLEPRSIGVKKETLEIVREGMRSAVNEKHGTGMYARSKKVVIAGKTGTAQNPLGNSHAWFVGFAPFEKPRLTLVVFVEHGGKGGLKPARYARKIVEKAMELGLIEKL